MSTFFLVHCASLDKYDHLVAQNSAQAAAPAEVKLTYLGCSGYLIEAPGAVVLIDPYFSRFGVVPLGLNAKLHPKLDRIEEGLAQAGVPSKVDAILVTHGHLDHLPDVPYIQSKLGGKVIASPSSCNLVQAAGVPVSAQNPALPGDVIQAGSAKIRILKASHDRLCGFQLFPGHQCEVPRKPPLRGSDWVCGQPLAFIVEVGGRRIYMDSGGMPGELPAAIAKGVDVAILGAALPDSRKRYLDVVDYLRPDYVLPNHQDNFFIPASKGFRFGPMTNFPKVLKQHEEAGLEAQSQLVLLDYFEPWALP